MSKSPFNKFIAREETGAQKKERIRQEKKQARKETQAYFEEKKRYARHGYIERTENKRENKRSSSFRNDGETQSGKRPTDKPAGKKQQGQMQQDAGETKGRSSVTRRQPSSSNNFSGSKSAVPQQRSSSGNNSSGSKSTVPQQRSSTPHEGAVARAGGNKRPVKPQTTSNPPANQRAAEPAKKPASATMPLNKFIAHAGICSRRDAAELVRTGKAIVNGQPITEPGFKVNGDEEIKVNGKKIALRKTLVYILLNKPKDFITTTEDPQGRKTVLDIVKKATQERVYPIGRLDRNTTGVLLLTNDGELAQKLSHPSYEVKKIYEVTLDKPLAKKDFDALTAGITLEDGLITPDALAYADPKDRAVIGIEIHSGRNRIVRRMFEHLGYDVRNLDRVMYANLTKKNVDRGKWRFLSEKEVRLLKFLNASYTRK